MGFINIMRSDFHLHLRAASVTDWRRSIDGDSILDEALDSAGEPIGLTVRSTGAAQQ